MRNMSFEKSLNKCCQMSGRVGRGYKSGKTVRSRPLGFDYYAQHPRYNGYNGNMSCMVMQWIT